MAISFGGTTFAWNSAQEIAMFCLSGVLLIALCIHQVWSDSKNRMFPVHFLKNGGLLIQFLVGASAGTSSFVTIYFIPLCFQFVQHSDSLLAGVRLLPFIGCLAVFTMLNGHLMARSGYSMLYKLDLSTSNDLFTAGWFSTVLARACFSMLRLRSPNGWLHPRRHRAPLDSSCVLEGEALRSHCPSQTPSY